MKRAKVIRATPEQKDDYEGVFPLYGFVTYNGIEMVIEDQSEDDNFWPPKPYHISAPDGYVFGAYNTIGMNCLNLNDVRDKAAYIEAGKPE